MTSSRGSGHFFALPEGFHQAIPQGDGSLRFPVPLFKRKTKKRRSKSTTGLAPDLQKDESSDDDMTPRDLYSLPLKLSDHLPSPRSKQTPKRKPISRLSLLRRANGTDSEIVSKKTSFKLRGKSGERYILTSLIFRSRLLGNPLFLSPPSGEQSTRPSNDRGASKARWQTYFLGTLRRQTQTLH